MMDRLSRMRSVCDPNWKCPVLALRLPTVTFTANAYGLVCQETMQRKRSELSLRHPGDAEGG